MDGSPEPSSSKLVEQLVRDADYVIAVDRGADVLQALGVVPDVFCGDADSVSAEAGAWAHGAAAVDIRYPSEKYATDLSLALDCARHEAARRCQRLRVTVTCASGGRADHLLAVYGLLARYVDASPRLVEDGYECRILASEGTAGWLVGEEAGMGSVFSALALREGTVVSEKGMRWELDHHRLELLGDLGVSNVVMTADAAIECHEGVVAAFLIRAS